jgi:membrane protein
MTNKASVRVIGALVGLVAGVTMLSVLANRVREEFGIGITSVSFLAVFALYAVAWTAITSLLPRGTRDPSVLLPGAVLVAATITGMQAVSQFYLPGQIGRASELYGAVGAAIVTLGWFFILGRVIVIALALNAVVHERLGSISHFVFSLPVLRILPRRSGWIRRYFGLDEERAAQR